MSENNLLVILKAEAQEVADKMHGSKRAKLN
jgi:hypothetical protein